MAAPFPSLCLITDTAYYPLFFKHLLASSYELTFLSASDFELKELKFILADIVVIDDQTFGEQIFHLLVEMKRMPHYQDKPIIVITSKLRKEHLHRLIQAGANDFIREPLEEQNILGALKNVQKYHTLSEKMHLVSEKMGSIPSEPPQTKGHFFLNRSALQQIHKRIKEGGFLSLLSIAIDRHPLLTEKVTEEIAHFIRSHLRTDYLFFPLGKGRFLLFLDNASAKKGFMIAESLKDEVSSKLFQTGSREEKFTLSIGIAAQKHPPYNGLKQMVEDAQQACLSASAQGNCVMIKEPL